MMGSVGLGRAVIWGAIIASEDGSHEHRKRRRKSEEKRAKTKIERKKSNGKSFFGGAKDLRQSPYCSKGNRRRICAGLPSKLQMSKRQVDGSLVENKVAPRWPKSKSIRYGWTDRRRNRDGLKGFTVQVQYYPSI